MHRFSGLLTFLFIAAVGLGYSQTNYPMSGISVPYGPQSTPRDYSAYLQQQMVLMEYGHRQLQNTPDKPTKEQLEEQKKKVDSGTISVLDLKAPPKAVREFNDGAKLLGEQKTKEAVSHLEKAIKQYPDFVSAHTLLGVAFQDLDDHARARAELEAANKLDPKFPGALVSLGRIELADRNLEAAQDHFEKAAALLPRDAGVLTLLCYSQNGNHQYRHAIDTAVQVHGLDHKGMPNVHYIAASSAIALRDYPVVKREMGLFVQEDPSNPLAPSARQNLDILAKEEEERAAAAAAAGSQAEHTFPNTDRLKNQLAALGNASADDCADCDTAPEKAGGGASPDAPRPAAPSSGYTFSTSVDEVAVFFAVTSRGRSIDDLTAGDVHILDANKPPQKILQFTPQSKLPLRLGLLVDTSSSVKGRFAFEKEAATKFVQKMLSNPYDLAFVAGFSLTPSVTQDFTADQPALAAGIDKLQVAGGTSLFDAVSFASWKLAEFPERERVATVLVVLTDGEDNSSKRSLKQAIRDAENSGVTIYTISTTDHGVRSDADRVLIEMAERTGGEAIFPGEILMLGRAFDKLHDIIRSRYMVAYRPADFVPNGAYRSINIAAQKNGSQFTVHARKGYHARRTADTSPAK